MQSLPAPAPNLAGFVGRVNWSLLNLLNDLRGLQGRGLQATAQALFGEESLAEESALEAILGAGLATAFLRPRALELMPLVVLRSDLPALEKSPGLPSDEVKLTRAAARRRYRDFEMALVRAFSRARPSPSVDPFEGLTLLKQSCRLSRPSLRPSPDELAARLAEGVVKLNLATLALLRALPAAGPDGARLARQLAGDGDGAAIFRAVSPSRVSDSLLFLIAVSSPPLATPALDRLRGLSLEGPHEEVEAAGRESRDRFQTLLAEFIRISEEEPESL